MSVNNTSERIEHLESKLAFQEHTIEALNNVIIEQQARIDELEANVEQVVNILNCMPMPEEESAQSGYTRILRNLQ